MTTLAQDSFNRANGGIGVADSGQSWVQENSNSYQILANQAAHNTGTTYAPVVLNCWETDVDLSCDVTVGASQGQAGVCLKFADVANYLFIQLVAIPTLNQLQLNAHIGGVDTTRATAMTGSVVNGTTYTLRVVTSGANVSVYVNGTLQFTYTLTSSEQSALSGATFHGLFSYVGGSNEIGNSRWDNFIVTGTLVTHDFGIYVVNSTLVRTYKDGVFLKEYAHPSYSGTLLMLAGFASVGCHIGGVEEWDQPGGTLLDSLTFPNLTGWSQNATDWSILPTNWAFNDSSSISSDKQLLWRTQDASAHYFVAKSVFFDNCGEPDGWAMIIPFRTSTTLPADGSNHDGYRCLYRPECHVEAPGDVEVPEGTAASGWKVGGVRIG